MTDSLQFEPGLQHQLINSEGCTRGRDRVCS